MDTPSDFYLYLQAAQQAIQSELTAFSKKWGNYLNTYFPDLKNENSQFTQSLFGGKMLRGALVKLGYELYSNSSSQKIYKPAAAYEILHAALLIHDDIIDQSPLRRGKPALHTIHADKHYGISQAICLGDQGIIQAIKMLLRVNFPDKHKSRVIDYFTQIISETILGEMLDVASAFHSYHAEEQILQIHQTKTAQYTFTGPLTLGAMLAGAPDELIKTIHLFGQPLGIAYQIKDDILSIFGDEKVTGKSITADIEENKSTLLLSYAIKHASVKQKASLKTYYGKKGITQKQAYAIKQIFIATGSLEYSNKQIYACVSKAKTIIPKLTKSKTRQQLLYQLTEFLALRNT